MASRAQSASARRSAMVTASRASSLSGAWAKSNALRAASGLPRRAKLQAALNAQAASGSSSARRARGCSWAWAALADGSQARGTHASISIHGNELQRGRIVHAQAPQSLAANQSMGRDGRPQQAPGDGLHARRNSPGQGRRGRCGPVRCGKCDGQRMAHALGLAAVESAAGQGEQRYRFRRGRRRAQRGVPTFVACRAQRCQGGPVPGRRACAAAQAGNAGRTRPVAAATRGNRPRQRARRRRGGGRGPRVRVA